VVVAPAQQPGAGKLIKAAVGGKVHRRGGRPTSHMSCKQTSWPEKTGAVSPPPVSLERGKHVTVVVAPRGTLINKAWGARSVLSSSLRSA
jgi:hypothetical protein